MGGAYVLNHLTMKAISGFLLLVFTNECVFRTVGVRDPSRYGGFRFTAAANAPEAAAALLQSGLKRLKRSISEEPKNII